MLVVAFSASAQEVYQQTADSFIKISGTSTLHDWVMTSTEPKVQVRLTRTTEGTLSTLEGATFTLRSESLKSGRQAMDHNTYSTLSTDEFKTINLSVTETAVTPAQLKCIGNITVCGVTKPITLDVAYKLNANGSIRCTGSKKLKMSDFGLEAPTFMFGTVRTGDEVTVDFSIMLVPSK